jgi:hypothetical protein
MEGAGLGDGMVRMLSPELRGGRGLELDGNTQGLSGLSTGLSASFERLTRTSLFFNASVLIAGSLDGPAFGRDRLRLVFKKNKIWQESGKEALLTEACGEERAQSV